MSAERRRAAGLRQRTSHPLRSPATRAIARPNSGVAVSTSLWGRRARRLGAYRAPGRATVCHPPLADPVEVAFVSGGAQAPRDAWGAQVHDLAVPKDQTDPIGAQLSEALDGLHLVPTDMAPQEPANVRELRGQVHPEAAHPQRFPHENATQDSKPAVSAPAAPLKGLHRKEECPPTNSTIQFRREVRMRTVASATPCSTLMAAPLVVSLLEARSSGTPPRTPTVAGPPSEGRGHRRGHGDGDSPCVYPPLDEGQNRERGHCRQQEDQRYATHGQPLFVVRVHGRLKST